jgi:hypothetical protein
MKISAQTKRAWRNRLIFVALVAAGILAYVIYINSFTIYDFSHLTVVQDFGPARPFEPMAGNTVSGMVRAAQTPYLALYINESDTTIAVADLRNGHIWYSSPPGTMQDERANPFERGTMRSHVGFRFFTETRGRQNRWLFPDSIAYGLNEDREQQFQMYSIPNGVRIEYIIGDLDIGIDFLPSFIEEEYFQERVFSHAQTRDEERFLIQFWFESEEKPGFMQMGDGVRSAINATRMLEFFDGLGWTAEETAAQNSLSGFESDISHEYFNLTIEFILDDNRLIANLPLSRFTTDTAALPSSLDFMKFFGAGGLDDDGFILVPSGSGGIITFNNGREREEPYMGTVYGMDNLVNFIRPQVMQSVRLPVFGIQNNGAAILAHVENGAALAVVNAEVSGRTNSFNNAWFSFNLRADTEISMPGGGTSMTIVQDDMHLGDITIVYHFIEGENPGVGGMAQTYQNYLVAQGILTPLEGAGDRSFYMDVVGAIDIQRHIVGTPYMTTEIMTTLDDANRFVDLLNDGGVSTIQMQLHGWFNRGVNHDVAKRIRRINDVGSRDEMLDLNSRLQENGGGLYPAVNFQVTNWWSRRYNRTFESAKFLAGYVGYMSRDTWRDTLSQQWSNFRNDWYNLIHPAVVPFHVDRFLPEYARRTAMDSIALTDLGDMVTESFFRRDAVDRESARLITQEQIGIIQNEIPNVVIFGGNNFSFPYASHIVDAPTQADMLYIIDYEVPFFPMVIHGFIEFAGAPANTREHQNFNAVLLNSMTTGASPRYTFTAERTRIAQFSPHERLYSTFYLNWMEEAILHYNIFNEVYAPLRAERIVGFEILAGRSEYVGGQQVTVTEFSNGTRIYVNNTSRDFNTGEIIIPAEWFYVQGGAVR